MRFLIPVSYTHLGLTWNISVSFRIAAKCTVGTAGGMGMRIPDGAKGGLQMEISHTAYLCVPASTVGYGLSVLYRFHELRAGNPGFGSSEKSRKHQDKQGKNTVVSA